MQKDEAPRPLLPAFLLALPVGFWGSSYVFTEIGARHASGLVFAGLRAAPAALVLLIVLPLLRARLPRGRTAVHACATGLLMVTFALYGISEGTVLAGPAHTSVLVNSAPLFVLVLGRLLGIERISVARIVGLVLGFGGVVAMVSSELGTGGRNVAAGMGLGLLAAVAIAVVMLAVKALTQRAERFDTLGYTAAQYLAGGPLLLAIALSSPDAARAEWSSPTLWWTALVVGLGATVGVIGFYAALKALTATRAAAVTFLVPVVAVLIDLGRGVVPGPVTLAGMVLAIAGVAVVNLPAGRLRALAAMRPRPAPVE